MDGCEEGILVGGVLMHACHHVGGLRRIKRVAVLGERGVLLLAVHCGRPVWMDGPLTEALFADSLTRALSLLLSSVLPLS